jgi:hypothetical protein
MQTGSRAQRGIAAGRGRSQSASMPVSFRGIGGLLVFKTGLEVMMR